jgi:dephospho-CoA kinase
MNLIGLTGGIGSGKSSVAALFHTLGIPVYDSDQRAKILMNSDEDVRKQITLLLGENAYAEDHTLNRSFIASQVFSNPSLLRQLNVIVHPVVYEDLKKWAAEELHLSAPYLIQESAILLEEDLTERLKALILVVAPEKIRIARIMERDGVTRDQVMKRMGNQWEDAKKIPFADYIIFNDGERSLMEQVMDIDQMIRSV